MGLPDLVSGLCDYLRIEPLEPDASGIYEIVFDDGLDVEILSLSDSQLLVRARIGDVPEEKEQREDFFRTQLQHNLLNLRGQFCSLSWDAQANIVWLYQMAHSNKIDVRGFCDLVNQFVNTLEWWRNLDNQTQATLSPAEMMPINMIRP